MKKKVRKKRTTKKASPKKITKTKVVKKKSGVTDLLKKTLALGLAPVLMSEDKVKNYLTDLKLPKEVLLSVINGVNKQKEELVKKTGDEIVKLFSKLDLYKEIAKFAQEHKIKVTAEFEFTKRSPKLNVKTSRRSKP